MRRETPRRILILGGTGLARQAAHALIEDGARVVTSLAGVTQTPQMPKGEVRTGGFGGEAGLLAYLKQGRFDCVVDATHSFAAQISRHAAAACAQANVHIVRLEPDAWTAQPGDRWTLVDTVSAAAAQLPGGIKVVLTIGRKEVEPFFNRSDIGGIARMIEPPQAAPPAGWKLMLERPPFTIETETNLLKDTAAAWLVSKNAGGPRPAKLDAARVLGVPVLMVKRPAKPPVATYSSIEGLIDGLDWLVNPGR